MLQVTGKGCQKGVWAPAKSQEYIYERSPSSLLPLIWGLSPQIYCRNHMDKKSTVSVKAFCRLSQTILYNLPAILFDQILFSPAPTHVGFFLSLWRGWSSFLSPHPPPPIFSTLTKK